MEDKDKIPGASIGREDFAKQSPQTPQPTEHFGVDDSVIGTEIVRRKMSFGEWVENFWYHHKWHLFAALFIIAVLAVCITQCAMNAKAPADVKVIYAGGKTGFHDTGKDGSVPFLDLESALSSLARDYDENGERIAELECYYWLSNAELDELRKKNEELPKDKQVDVSYHAQVIKESNNSISTLLITNDYYVWLLSEELYLNLISKSGGEGRFDPLDVLAEDGAALPFYVDEDGEMHKTAVYLSELGAGELEGLCDLPEDTLLVLKHPSALDRDLSEYENATDYIRLLLNS